MNFAAIATAFSVVKRAWPLIKAVADFVEHTFPNNPGVQKAQVAIEIISKEVEEFRAMSPELQTAFNAAVRLYKFEKKLLEEAKNGSGQQTPGAQ